MSEPSVPQADPKAGYLAQRAEIDAAIARVLEAGHYILGEEVASFEREFAHYVGRRYCVGVASGTDALVGAVRALAPTDSDYVITTSHTSVATVAAIEMAGARALLLDIDAASFTLDAEELARIIEHPPGRILAIIVVHLYGNAADLHGILPLARRYGVPVIEDCAQCHGARLDAKPLGSFGDMAVFSFYPTKNLGAIGDGGAIVLDDPQRFEQLKSYRQYGWSARHVSEFAGACTRLDELQAAILRTKLPRLDADNARRRRIAATYQQGLDSSGLVCPHIAANVMPAFHQYVVRSAQRDTLRAALGRRGVNTNIHYPVPVHLQPAYRGRVALGPSGLPRSERAAQEVLSLPMYPQLSDAQIEHVLAAVNAACLDL
jgi:dTDP-4-amino-4,6-dideoxygalactose transaminase